MTFTTDATEVSKVVACYIAGVLNSMKIPLKKKDLATMRHNIDAQLSKEVGMMGRIAADYEKIFEMPEQKEEEVKLEIVKG